MSRVNSIDTFMVTYEAVPDVTALTACHQAFLKVVKHITKLRMTKPINVTQAAKTFSIAMSSVETPVLNSTSGVILRYTRHAPMGCPLYLQYVPETQRAHQFNKIYRIAKKPGASVQEYIQKVLRPSPDSLLMVGQAQVAHDSHMQPVSPLGSSIDSFLNLLNEFPVGTYTAFSTHAVLSFIPVMEDIPSFHGYTMCIGQMIDTYEWGNYHPDITQEDATHLMNLAAAALVIWNQKQSFDNKTYCPYKSRDQEALKELHETTYHPNFPPAPLQPVILTPATLPPAPSNTRPDPPPRFDQFTPIPPPSVPPSQTPAQPPLRPVSQPTSNLQPPVGQSPILQPTPPPITHQFSSQPTHAPQSQPLLTQQLEQQMQSHPLNNQQNIHSHPIHTQQRMQSYPLHNQPQPERQQHFQQRQPNGNDTGYNGNNNGYNGNNSGYNGNNGGYDGNMGGYNGNNGGYNNFNAFNQPAPVAKGLNAPNYTDSNRGSYRHFPDAPDTWPEFAIHFGYQNPVSTLHQQDNMYQGIRPQYKPMFMRPDERLTHEMNYNTWEENLWNYKTLQAPQITARQDIYGVVLWGALSTFLQQTLLTKINFDKNNNSIVQFIQTFFTKTGAVEWLTFNLAKECLSSNTSTSTEAREIITHATVHSTGSNMK